MSNGPKLLAHVGRLIYIQTIFDTETILKTYGKSTDCKNPTGLSHNAGQPSVMYMLTNWDNQISGQATGNLEIKAKVNDVINWRSSTLSNNTGDAAVFNAIQTDTQGVIGTPQLMLTRPSVPVPTLPGGCPCQYSTEVITDSYWYSLVAATGSTTYRCYFWILTEDSSGNPIRYYYWWDPKVTVS